MGIITAIGGFVTYNGSFTSETTYVASTTPIVQIEEVDVLEKRITDRQKAKMAEIEAKAQKAYQDTYDHEMRLIEAAVLSEYEAEISARKDAIEKQTGDY